MSKPRILIGITGASGAIYAQRVLERLARAGRHEILVVVSHAGRRLLAEELGADIGDAPGEFASWLRIDRADADRLRLLPVEDIGAGPASGSFRLDAMAIVPCSMRTLAAVSSGLAGNLLTRAADVCIKENRRLVIVPRECPFSAIHLENMLRLARLGVRIVPPSPGFYRHPETLDDLVDFVVEKILGALGEA